MKIEFWQNDAGREPALEFIERQPNKAAQRIIKSIDHFADQGMRLLTSPSKMRPIAGYRNLYELRIQFNGIFYRIIFCIVSGIAHMLLGFKKKGNRTPDRHIKTALVRQRSLSPLT